VIGTASVLRPEKGLGDLIEAFAEAEPERRKLALLVVGSGPERPALEAQAGRLGVSAYCRFISDTKDVAGWMRKMDVFVLPSHSEALSNSLMEAMTCGCAVIASAVGGNPELVTEAETGLLFPARQPKALAAALASLADEPGFRERLARAGEAKMRGSYSLEAAATRLAAIYDRFALPEKGTQ
jgi:glycosyltransferase involved in cell wall biosynthesis